MQITPTAGCWVVLILGKTRLIGYITGFITSMKRLNSSGKVSNAIYDRMVLAYDQWHAANPHANVYQLMDRWFCILREFNIGY